MSALEKNEDWAVEARLRDLDAAGLVELTKTDRAVRLAGVSARLAAELCELLATQGWSIAVDDAQGVAIAVGAIEEEGGPYCIFACKPLTSWVGTPQTDDFRADVVAENARLREMLRRAASGWAVHVSHEVISVRHGADVLEVDLSVPFVDPRHASTVDVVAGLIPAIDELRASGLDQGRQQETWAENLRWMVDQIVAHPEWPIDKPSRWTGFIQGVLAVHGFMSVKKERDRTRSFFHRAYDLLGFRRPKTISKEE